MSIGDAFPGDWYASADRPSAPSAKRILDAVRAGVCVDCGNKVDQQGFWWCGVGRCDTEERGGGDGR